MRWILLLFNFLQKRTDLLRDAITATGAAAGSSRKKNGNHQPWNAVTQGRKPTRIGKIQQR